MAGVSIQLDGYDELIAEINRIEKELTGDILRDVVGAGGEVVAARARQICRRGDPRHKPELKPLADTIEMVTKSYGQRAIAVVGPGWPAGAHGHNVEHGHDIVARGQGKNRGRGRVKGGKKADKLIGGRTKPQPFMRPAFDETYAQQMAAMEAVAARKVRELGGE